MQELSQLVDQNRDVGPVNTDSGLTSNANSLRDAPSSVPAQQSKTSSKRPYRVLYLDHTAKQSGGEIALMRFLRAIDKAIVTPLVVLGEDGPIVESLRGAGIETQVLPLDESVREIRKDSLSWQSSFGRISAVLLLVRYARTISKIVRQRQIDVIHTNSLKSDLYGGAAGLLTKTPVVWHVRDHIDPSYLPMPAVAVFRLLARWIPSYIVANSESTRERLKLTRRHASIVVPSGVDLHDKVIPDGLRVSDVHASVVLAHAPQWPETVQVGIIGRLAPWKGQHHFIRAAADVLAAGYRAKFLIVGSAMFGEDAYEQELRQMVRDLGLTDNVVFTGFQSDIATVLHQLNILVHASTSPEPFGQVVIEGMAAGLPVIGTDGGGVREIITSGENGLLIPMDDAPALAEALKKLLRDPQYAQRLANAGSVHVQRNFTIEETARRIVSVYSQLLEKRQTN